MDTNDDGPEQAMTAPQATLDALLDDFARDIVEEEHGNSFRDLAASRQKIHAHFAASAQTAAGGIGEQGLDRARPTSKRIAAVEILSGMGYQWRDGTWGPWAPPAVPASDDGAHRRIGAPAQQPARKKGSP